jgi:hypothetical protein
MRLRVRFWVEVTLAALTMGLFLLTLASPTWIETTFGVDPDRDSGSLEWLLVAVLIAATATLILAARAEWRRVRVANA